MSFNLHLVPTFMTTCLWAAAGCANARLPEIKNSGQIAEEAAAPAASPAYGPWTAACLDKGRRAHGPAGLLAVNRPVFDLATFKFTHDRLRFVFTKDDKTGFDALRAGRFIGRMVMRNPNDATLAGMDDLTSKWNRDIARNHAGKGLDWKRDPAASNVWRSARLVFLNFRIEGYGGNAKMFKVHPLDEQKAYGRLYRQEDDSYRRDHLLRFSDLVLFPQKVAPSLSPSGFFSLFLPAYQGQATFETEVVETYRPDGSLAGCLPVVNGRKD